MVAPVLLTADECAARLGVSRAVIYAALQAGELPGYRIGRPGRRGTWRVTAYDLDQWVQTLKVSRPPKPAAARPKPTQPPRLTHLRLD